MVVFTLDDLLLALLVAFLAREDLVALLTIVGVGGRVPKRVFIVMVTARVVCIGEEECLW